MFKEFNLDNLENSKELLEKFLDENRKKVDELLKIENKTYKNFVLPFQEIGESINDFLTPIFHIDSVKNSEITTKVYEECIPVISKYETEISQNENIYLSFKDIQSKEKSTLNDIQNKVLENEIRDFKLSGCHLENNKKKRLEEISLRLSELSHKFSKPKIFTFSSFKAKSSSIIFPFSGALVQYALYISSLFSLDVP